MKGLLINNLYAAYAAVKMFAAAMILLGIFVIAVVSQPLQIGYGLLSMVGFPMVSILSLQKENGSKWGNYKLTAPVRRIDIIRSYFVSQLLWLIVGVSAAAVVTGLSILLHGFPFDRNIDILMLLTLGISISLLSNAIFFPIHYLSDGEKNEVLLIISLLCSIGIVMALSSFTNWLFGPSMTLFQLLISIAMIAVFAIAALILSFPLTVLAFKKREY